jgi:diketogulonate reductase-like aldo/keto reductase
MPMLAFSATNGFIVLNSGYKMPILGFGTSNLLTNPIGMKETVYEALKTGYRYNNK